MLPRGRPHRLVHLDPIPALPEAVTGDELLRVIRVLVHPCVTWVQETLAFGERHEREAARGEPHADEREERVDHTA